MKMSQASSSRPRPQLVKAFCKDVWRPPRNRPTLANLSKEDYAAVWCSINLKLTTSLFDTKAFFKDGMVMVWEPKYGPAIQDIMRFMVEYKHAILFMMRQIGELQTMMDVPNHPCLGDLASYEMALD
jgi:hypothetical protein